MSFAIVITTIQDPTPAVIESARIAREQRIPVIVIGDKKGPVRYELDGTQFYSLERQLQLDYRTARMVPTGHYSRKNIGYLLAFESGVTGIYETDDDNQLLPTWALRYKEQEVVCLDGNKWINPYIYYTNKPVWPRGYPLDEVRSGLVRRESEIDKRIVKGYIQQGLADESPDVDAIWRLLNDEVITFERNESVGIGNRSWCPFNSQSTWWFKEAFPLMYLPSYCSFRMTDIWRSFVAQYCLRGLDGSLVFHDAEVVQKRNEHDLMRDFKEEVDGYIMNKRIVEILESVKIADGVEQVSSNLYRCWEAIVRNGIVGKEEMELLECWISDYERVIHNANMSRRNIQSQVRNEHSPVTQPIFQ